ncbi:hypothetical protein KT71_06267 [Congregibacter litoralis KT71]|uniref:Secreted protein n=1 Tax=Congregibacter litoralis KT71 TaxID=314285 RepID=A4ABU4_9GAMM|nr:hypothetical protein KT71_06267 [Congregibacter litoralis KT71]
MRFPLPLRSALAIPLPSVSSTIRLLRCFLASFLLLSSSQLFAAPLFDSDQQLAITVSGPFERIDRERDKEQEYPGSLSYNDPELGPKTLDAKFSVRGNFRLRKDICSHAQLWVNLKKSQVKGTLFAKQDKLKLVVQCKDPDRYAEYIGREQQAYRIFQTLSDLSLDTRMLEVTYADSEGGDARTQIGFFIQHQNRLAKENDMTVFKEMRADKSLLNPERSALVALYMYLVSNTDYSFIAAAPGETCCHNIKLLEAPDGGLYPLPYDYDSTGYVNTSYAEPAGGIGQRKVTQRMYRGYCAPEELTAGAIEHFQANRDAIYAIVEDTRFVTERSVKRTRKFVDKFYDVLDNPKKVRREIIEECR